MASNTPEGRLGPCGLALGIEHTGEFEKNSGGTNGPTATPVFVGGGWRAVSDARWADEPAGQKTGDGSTKRRAQQKIGCHPLPLAAHVDLADKMLTLRSQMRASSGTCSTTGAHSTTNVCIYIYIYMFVYVLVSNVQIFLMGDYAPCIALVGRDCGPVRLK